MPRRVSVFRQRSSGRLRPRRLAPLLAGLLWLGAPAAAEDLGAVAVRAAAEARSLRRLVGGEAAAGVEESWTPLSYRGRPSLELKGRGPGGTGPGRAQDYTVYDLASGRVVLFIFFPHASARRAGEPILPMSEASSAADALLTRLLPGEEFSLVGVERLRQSGQEAVYYEVRYGFHSGEVRFLRPPVRLLLDASTARLFRLEIAPEYRNAPPLPRAAIGRRAAERIAEATLRALAVAGAFGPGAAPGSPAAADLYYVQPNDWLGLSAPDPRGRPRPAWVVTFPVRGAQRSEELNSLFIDAAGGRLLGGMAGAPY